MSSKKINKKQSKSIPVSEHPAKRKKIVSLAQYEADAKTQKTKDDVAATVEAVEKGNLAEGITVPVAKKRPSGLDSAVAVLAEAGKPMNTGDIVKRMLDTGMWKTSGKTPASTIFAAISREIQTKGQESRFRKTERGMFELVKA